jgi:pyruvyl transferase EpsO
MYGAGESVVTNSSLINAKSAVQVEFDWDFMRTCLAAALRRVVPEGSPVIYLDYPVTNNVGDILIYLGTIEWLRFAGVQLRGAYPINGFKFTPIEPDVIILLNGGGNLGDIYPSHQDFREKVIIKYRKNRIVILPQTVHFQISDARAKASIAFSTHLDLHLLVRDHKSHGIAAAAFPRLATLETVPDMATFLYPLDRYLNLNRIVQGTKFYYLIRRDIEKLVQEPPMMKSSASDWLGDWVNLLPTFDRAMCLACIWANQWGGSRVLGTAFEKIWWRVALKAVRSTARHLLRAKMVVSSRLHGYMIAKLLDLPAAMLDNNYGKNSSYTQCWGRDQQQRGHIGFD